MSNTHPLRGLQLQSLIRPEGELELALVQVDTPEPGPNEIVLRIEAAPINPSDIGLLFGAADLATAKGVLIDGHPALRVAVPERGMRAMAPRVGMAIPCGNEGAGTVVRAGSSPEAQALLGRTVAGIGGGGMYAQYRCLRLDQCLPLPAGATAEQGASCFVNPLTALGMVETMKAHSVDTFRQQSKCKRGAPRGVASTPYSGGSSRLRGPSTWISALLVASGMGLTGERDSLQGAPGKNEHAQHAKGKHQN